MTAGSFRVVGLDGGATHTRYVLADGDGRPLGTAESGPSLLGAGEDLAVADRIIEAVWKLCLENGGPFPADVVCAGLAGAAGRPAARKLVEERLAEAGVAKRVVIVTDSEVAFADAFGPGDGILVIAGTGSVAVGRVRGGELRRVGGWGRLLGDEGSGYLMGLQGLRAAVRGAEGRGPETTLTRSLFGALAATSVQEVFEWCEGASKGEIAAVAPHVAQQADEGDPEAARIVTEAVDALVRHAEALWRTAPPLTDPKPEVALVGGVIEPGGILRDRVVAALAVAGFETLTGPVNPARGAVRVGLARA